MFDHSNGSTLGYSERLNGSANEKFGIAKSLSVMPGDTLKLEVYAKYVDQTSSNWTQALTDFLGAIASGTAPAGTVVDGAGYANSTSSFSYAGLLNTSGSTGNGPKAYINWLIFDRDYNFVNGGYKRMSDVAKEQGQNVAHEKLSALVPITQPGYVYVYLSNEETSVTEIFFDDLKVTHVKSPVIGMDDYYPGGAPYNSFTRENSLINKRKYQSKEWQTDLGLELYDFGPRQYNPWILQTTSHDPHAERYYEWSPYSWGFDNPIRYGDPTGMDPIDKALGFMSAVVDNALGGVTPLRSLAARYVDDAEDFNTGQDGGDVFSMVSGVMEAESGAGLTTGSVIVTGVTGGLSIEVTGPTALVGLGMTAHGAVTTIAGANNFMNQKGRLNAEATQPYKRPNNATTPEQRKSVQDKPCTTCGKEGGKRIADHKKPLVKEHYETGTINKKKMRDPKSVQPQCEKCSQQQGAEMSRYSREQKKLLQLRQEMQQPQNGGN